MLQRNLGRQSWAPRILPAFRPRFSEPPGTGRQSRARPCCSRGVGGGGQQGLPDPDGGPRLAASLAFNCSRPVVSLFFKGQRGGFGGLETTAQDLTDPKHPKTKQKKEKKKKEKTSLPPTDSPDPSSLLPNEGFLQRSSPAPAPQRRLRSRLPPARLPVVLTAFLPHSSLSPAFLPSGTSSGRCRARGAGREQT